MKNLILSIIIVLAILSGCSQKDDGYHLDYHDPYDTSVAMAYATDMGG